ncbi:MAG: outer membrane protein assembly factor BamB family protein, partial [Planctomycetota bacterium]
MKKTIPLSFILIAFYSIVATAQIRHVPAEYNNIQAAVDDCNDGDTVLVADGTYLGTGNYDIELDQKTITIRSENGPESCTIECNGLGRAFYLTNNTNGTVEGFTIIYGYGNPNGGGIYCTDSRLTLINCSMTGNTADQNGGGLYFSNTFSVVNNCTIAANDAGNNGGGIYGDDNSFLKLTNCVLWANTDVSGGGETAQIHSLWASSLPGLDILYNCIQDNDPHDSNVPFGDPNYHNIDDDPMFVRDPNDGGDGWGDEPATTGIDEGANDDFGDLHLQSISPCINTGFPSFLGVSNKVDMDGQPRIIGDRIDMGVDEFAPMLVVTKPQADEIWIQNSTHQINWSDYGIAGNVDISYSDNNGADWTPVENNVANTGSYIWQLPPTVDSNQCLVSVAPNTPDPCAVCVNSGLFTIKPDFIHPQVSSKWKSLGGDFDRTGLSQNYGPELGCVKWQFETNARITGSVTIGADNRAHIACEDGKLYTLNSADGSLLWTYDAGSPLLSSPTVGPQGSLYVGSLDGRLHAVSIGGTLRWTHNTDGFIYSSPAISDDGDIYVCSQDGSLYALGNDGSELWTFDTNSFTASTGSVLASPSLGPDGTIYIAGLYDPNLYALDPNDGSIKWACTFDSEGWPFASSVVAEDNTIYQTLAYDHNLYAIDATAGTLFGETDLAGTVWEEDRGDDSFIWYGPGELPDPPQGYSPTGKYPYAYGWSEPVLSPEGTVYVSLDDAHLRAVDPNSTIKWVTRLGIKGGFTLTVGNDGLIYAAGDDGYLCVLDNTGAELARFQRDGDWLNLPVIAADNTLTISDSKDNTVMNDPPNNILWAITGDDCQGSESVLHRPEDLSANRTVNLGDFALLAGDWLSCTEENGELGY